MAAAAQITTEEKAAMEQLRTQYDAQIQENLRQRDEKGYIDDGARKALTGIETEMNAKGDALRAEIGAIAKTVTAITERVSRPPGSGSVELVKTVGRKFAESDSFKSASFAGKFSVQAGLTKTRILDRKAAIAEGGATTITPPVGAYPIFPVRIGIIPQLFAPPTMRDLVDVIPLDNTNAVEYVTENWTNNAGYQVAEGDKKAESTVVYTEYTAVVRTIAHFVKVSRQMASDVSFIINTIEQRLINGVLLKEDREILLGDNTAGHLWGIMPQATPATTYYVGPAPATDTAVDQLRAAAVYVESQFLVPSAYVLNPVTWGKIEGLKTSLGTYVLPGLPTEAAPARLWGLPVLTTPNMPATDYLCGAFPGNAALFDRETVNVEMAFQNEDDFVRNLITLRAEERVAFAVYVPKAFAKGPFITVTPAGGLTLPEGENGGARGVKRP